MNADSHGRECTLYRRAAAKSEKRHFFVDFVDCSCNALDNRMITFPRKERDMAEGEGKKSARKSSDAGSGAGSSNTSSAAAASEPSKAGKSAGKKTSGSKKSTLGKAGIALASVAAAG